MNHNTLWVCQCCLMMAANGECCYDSQHGGDGATPLANVEGHSFPGMAWEEHDGECAFNVDGGNAPDGYECDCETVTFSKSQCEGCGSYLYGARHALTTWDLEPCTTTT